MSERTDSDGEKENYDDIEPPKQHQKLKLPPSVKGKQRFAEMVSAEEMESLSKGFAPPKYGKEHKEGSFNFSAVNCCTK